MKQLWQRLASIEHRRPLLGLGGAVLLVALLFASLRVAPAVGSARFPFLTLPSPSPSEAQLGSPTPSPSGLPGMAAHLPAPPSGHGTSIDHPPSNGGGDQPSPSPSTGRIPSPGPGGSPSPGVTPSPNPSGGPPDACTSADLIGRAPKMLAEYAKAESGQPADPSLLPPDMIQKAGWDYQAYRMHHVNPVLAVLRTNLAAEPTRISGTSGWIRFGGVLSRELRLDDGTPIDKTRLGVVYQVSFTCTSGSWKPTGSHEGPF